MSVVVVIGGDVFDDIDTLFPGFSKVILGGDLDEETCERLVASRHEKPREWLNALEPILDALADIIHELVDQDQFEAAKQVCRMASSVKNDIDTMIKLVPVNEIEA